jgi:hypothetical protein
LQITKDPTSQVKAEFENVCTLNDRDAKHLYLQICHIVASYNCEYFRVRLLSGAANKRPNCLIGVGPRNLLVVDEKTKELMGNFAFLSDVKWQLVEIVEKGFFLLASKAQKQLKIKVRELPEELVFAADEGVLEAIDKRLLYHRHHNEEDLPESPRMARSRAFSVAAMYRERKAMASSMPSDIIKPSPSHSRAGSFKAPNKMEATHRSSTVSHSSSSSLQPSRGTLSPRLNPIFQEEGEFESRTPPGSPGASPPSSPTTERRHPSTSATLESIRQRLASLKSSAVSPVKEAEAEASEAVPESFCACPELPVRTVFSHWGFCHFF